MNTHDLLVMTPGLIAVLLTFASSIYGAGRLRQQVQQASADAAEAAAAVKRADARAEETRDDFRDSLQEQHLELREVLGALKEFTRDQATNNAMVAKTLESTTARLQQVGDIVMQHQAIMGQQQAIAGLHDEVLRRNNLMQG